MSTVPQRAPTHDPEDPTRSRVWKVTYRAHLACGHLQVFKAPVQPGDMVRCQDCADEIDDARWGGQR